MNNIIRVTNVVEAWEEDGAITFSDGLAYAFFCSNIVMMVESAEKRGEKREKRRRKVSSVIRYRRRGIPFLSRQNALVDSGFSGFWIGIVVLVVVPSAIVAMASLALFFVK